MAFGLFSKDRGLKKAIERVNNRHAQSPDRWAAMEKLRDIGTEEALDGLCRRFSFACDKTIEDQQEKSWVVDTLAAKGDEALGPLRRYMKRAQSLGYPLAALARIADGPTALEVIDELLADEEPGYTRDPKRRIDIIEWLGEWDGADAAAISQRVVPYLEDFDENVRVKSIETLALRPHESAHEALLAAMVREEEESRRVRQRIAEVVAERKVKLGSHADQVGALTGDVLAGYKVQGDTLQKN